MLRRDPQPSFSDLWYRVAGSRPRLSVHAHVTRQQYGPEVSYIVEDPVGGNYYRLSASAYFFLGLLDGRRTADEAWQACCVQLGDAAPTQKECLDLIAKLQLFGLVSGADPLSPDMLDERLRQSKSQRVQRRTGRGVFWNIPLINPERFLERFRGLWRVVFSRLGAAAWVLLVGGALVLIARDWRALAAGVGSMLDPANLPALAILFVAIRIVHEFGHAAACKAMGGRCSEIGIILIAFVIPLPYCDASSAWRFPETWRRVLVSAGGMLVETFFAAIAAIVWVATEEGSLAHSLAFQTVIISGISTIVFNANPLLRYDGYYILSDIAGIPNLAQRSKDLWRYFIERFAFGVRGSAVPRVRDRAELWIMAVYGLLSPPYRFFVSLAIILVVASHYLTLGLVIAAVLLVMMFVWPAMKATGYLLGSTKLIGHRSRAVGLSLAAIAIVIGVVGMLPFPAGAYASGVLEPANRSVIRAGEDGFVKEVLVAAGERVDAGQTLFVLDNPQLVRDVATLEARLARALITRDEATRLPTADVEAADRVVDSLRFQLADARRRVESLSVRAPISGIVAAVGGPDLRLDNLTGQFLPRGTTLALVASTEELQVRAALSDRDRAFVFRDADIGAVPAAIRVRGNAGEKIPARAYSMAPAASRSLIEEALAVSAGGDVLLDPSDPQGQRTLDPHALVQVRPLDIPAGLQAGQRVRVRFAGPDQPLAAQVWRRVSQYISARFSL